MRSSCLTKRSPGHEGDPVLRAKIYNEIGFAVRKAVAILHRDDGHDGASALDVFAGHVRERNVTDLALLAKLGQGFNRGFKGNRVVGSVELVDIDAFKAQPLETALQRLGQVFGACIVGPLAWSGALPSAFGGDHQISRIRIERLGDQFFRCAGPVGVGRINQVDAKLDGAAQRRERCGFVGGGPQMPGPVMRMAPKPRRFTVRSPPSLKAPAAAAVMDCVVFMIFSKIKIGNSSFEFRTAKASNSLRRVG